MAANIDTSGVKSLDFTVFKNVINGKLVNTKTCRQGINPVSATSLLDVPVATEEDLDEAVDAARAAFPSWSRTLLAERKKLVLQYADAIEKERAGFVSLLTTEQGKPVCDGLSRSCKLTHSLYIDGFS